MTPFTAELIGTMILIVFGGGVCAGVNLKKTFSHDSGWIVIVFGWGFAVMLGAYVAGDISGAHLNPALTIGLAVAGKFLWSQVLSYIAAQMIGAFLGAVIVWLFYYPHWEQTEDPAAKLSVFSTAPAVPNFFFNLISEMIGTFFLVFILLVMGAEGMAFADGLKNLIVGFLIVAIGISLGGQRVMRLTRLVILAPSCRFSFADSRKRGFQLGICVGAGSRTGDWRNRCRMGLSDSLLEIK